ncbi:hypothetical protein VTK73DRAFT_7312 [Phialemonium thermophilum]|uniref:INO80 complex subunit B-like conserved region domain-containing protein n=1 Tax=Phialemonium thermophilum TaxID=223376 RepID=A0ABR3WFD9_9PEZI
MQAADILFGPFRGQIDNERPMSSRQRRTEGRGIATVSRQPASSSPASSPVDSGQHMHLTVKVPSSKLRQATSGGSRKRGDNSASTDAEEDISGDEIVAVKRSTRGGKKNYVVESDSDEDEDVEEDEVEEEDEIQVGNSGGVPDEDEEEEEEDDDDDGGEEAEEDEEMGDLVDEDAEGEEVEEDEMDVDAQGEDNEMADEDAEGGMDLDASQPPAPPAIKISKPVKGTASTSKGKSESTSKAPGKASTSSRKSVRKSGHQDDDEDLSELESEVDEGINDTVEVGGEEAAGLDEEDMDAEGEEIEVVDEDAEGEEESPDSDDEGSRAETPDFSRMTARQRAKHGDVAQEYMKLSDEVQVKKHFTAEELSMRRAEMARRRRNLSEKRNEEVKMETINKLLKKQAPKTNRRTGLGGDETPDADANKPSPIFVRWVSTREGNKVAVPEEILSGPGGRVFGAVRGFGGDKMVEEVS